MADVRETERERELAGEEMRERFWIEYILCFVDCVCVCEKERERENLEFVCVRN